MYSHTSEGWKCKIKVPAWLILGEASLPSLWTAAFSLCAHTASLVPVLGGRALSSYKGTNPSRGAPSSWPHQNLNTSQVIHLRTSSQWGLGELGLQHTDLGGATQLIATQWWCEPAVCWNSPKTTARKSHKEFDYFEKYSQRHGVSATKYSGTSVF